MTAVQLINIQRLLEAAEYLERRERGEFNCVRATSFTHTHTRTPTNNRVICCVHNFKKTSRCKCFYSFNIAWGMEGEEVVSCGLFRRESSRRVTRMFSTSTKRDRSLGVEVGDRGEKKCPHSIMCYNHIFLFVPLPLFPPRM